jgi:predicted Zn-dependent protease with MMP-like domain
MPRIAEIRGIAAFPGHRHNDPMPVEMGPAEFDALVDRALDGIPDEIVALVRNVVVLVEEEPPADDPDLLGLYDGVALTERWGDPMMELPDRIFVFRNPLLDMCESEEELENEVRITVVHEVAHHFGIDDDRLHDLGYA